MKTTFWRNDYVFIIIIISHTHTPNTTHPHTTHHNTTHTKHNTHYWLFFIYLLIVWTCFWTISGMDCKTGSLNGHMTSLMEMVEHVIIAMLRQPPLPLYNISIAHVIIIIKSEVSTFPIVIIFFRGCVPQMFVTSYSVTYCIYVPGKPGICFHHYCAVYDECKYSDTFWLADRTRLFVQYTISLSSLCKLIWRHLTYKMTGRYILSSVWVRLSIFSPISIIQYVICGAVCFQFSYPFLLWWLREYIYFVLLSSSNRKYELLRIV